MPWNLTFCIGLSRVGFDSLHELDMCDESGCYLPGDCGHSDQNHLVFRPYYEDLQHCRTSTIRSSFFHVVFLEELLDAYAIEALKLPLNPIEYVFSLFFLTCQALDFNKGATQFLLRPSVLVSPSAISPVLWATMDPISQAPDAGGHRYNARINACIDAR